MTCGSINAGISTIARTRGGLAGRRSPRLDVGGFSARKRADSPPTKTLAGAIAGTHGNTVAEFLIQTRECREAGPDLSELFGHSSPERLSRAKHVRLFVSVCDGHSCSKTIHSPGAR